MRIRELLFEGSEQLKDAGVPEAEYDARELLKSAFGIDTKGYLLSATREITEDEETKVGHFRELIDRRAARAPLQHILGYAWFMGLKFDVSPLVLIPRPDTEVLCEAVLEHEKARDMRVLDLGTGSGCIAISLKKLGGFKSITASDISAVALELAQKNAAKNCVDIDFVQSDLFENILGYDSIDAEGFDIIVSNPPYIPGATIDTLSPEVRDHDPHLALDGGVDGLKFYRLIASECRGKALKPKGRLYLEIGYDQADAVSKILNGAGFEDVTVLKDLAGQDRVVYGRKIAGN